MFNIVLVEPEIPQNTGNIARTCAVCGCSLHLVYPLGFTIDDKKLKRAGLDYWDKLDIHYYNNFDEVAALGGRLILATTKGAKSYTEIAYKANDFIVFGKETAGLGEKILTKYPDNHVRIPMRKTLRSLNLSNSVAIIVYEAMRQNGFPGMD